MSQARERLIIASKRLAADWQGLKELWRDEACRHFEQRYIDLIRKEVQACLVAMELAQQAIDRAIDDTKDRT